MVQLPRERVRDLRTCGGQMGPAHKARDDGPFKTRPPRRTPGPRSNPPPTKRSQGRRARPPKRLRMNLAPGIGFVALTCRRGGRRFLRPHPRRPDQHSHESLSHGERGLTRRPPRRREPALDLTARRSQGWPSHSRTGGTDEPLSDGIDALPDTTQNAAINRDALHR